MIQMGDHVLGRVRSMSGGHISESGACDYYVPATICAMPQQPTASYSLLAYNKRQVCILLIHTHTEHTHRAMYIFVLNSLPYIGEMPKERHD